MEKEGSANIKFFISILVLSALMLFMVFAVTVDFIVPGNNEINNTAGRNINFTFNATWESLDTGDASNCELWTNFTGSWVLTAANTTNQTIVNQSRSAINYTFPHDIGVMVWAIGCYNASPSQSTGILNFTSSNRTLAVDTDGPKVIQSADIFQGFNTSNANPTVTINLTDINGTGINITGDGNASLNISISTVPTNSSIRYYNVSNENLTCSPQDGATTNTQCTVDISAFSLSNGTKNITVSVTDRAGHTNETSFTFTVDNIPPVFDYYNITDEHLNYTDNTGNNLTNATQLGVGHGNSTAQGRTIYAIANWTDNLTQPSFALFQFYNDTKTGSNKWQTLNTTNVTEAAAGSWSNFTLLIPTGHNEFEGMNVSFRIVANDTVGNVNDSLIAKNFTIQVNDTTIPAITITGTATVNGTNLSSTAFTASWSINEFDSLLSVNVSIDGTDQATETSNGCNLFKQFVGVPDSGSPTDPNANRNSSFSVSTSTTCPLVNGTHFIEVIATDTSNNTGVAFHNFSLQTGSAPGLFFNLTKEEGVGTWDKSTTTATNNETNITSLTGITLYGANGATGVAKIVYLSSCDSSSVTIDNGTIVYPFNASSCNVQSENRTLTVTINDTAGNTNTTVLGFLVDNVAPVITVLSPTDGQTFSNTNVSFNVSALDDDQAITAFGYYLDGDEDEDFFLVNESDITGFGGAGINSTQGVHRNHTGTHTIKVSVNDSLGNVRNSSRVTFTQIGALDIAGPTGFNLTIKNNLGANNVTNVSFRNSSGADIQGEANIGQTLQLFLPLNGSGVQGANINITLNFNGSAANWNKTTEVYVTLNDSSTETNLRTNQTADIINYVFVNSSLQKFLSNNNSYYGKVTLPLDPNATDNGTFGTNVELWYFADENDFTARTNITQCSTTLTLSHGLTSGLPCWDTTDNATVDVYVPHFSVVAAVNNTIAPTINVTAPTTNQTVSMFVPNITVSSDAIECRYIVNGTANETMSKNGNICLGSTERFKNLENANAYSINFTVTDSSGNANVYALSFNVSDNTAPNEPNSTRVSSSVGSTSATVTITGMNETVNATVLYGTAVGTLTSLATQTDFNQTQAVSITSLSASTLYHFNVSVCDYAGNCEINGTFNFTTSAAASTSSSSSSSSSGTGTGGGGGGGGTVSTVTDSKAQVWSSVPAGTSFSLDVDKSGIGVTSITVDGTKAELSNVELSVAALSENPVSSEPAEKVFQYLRINKKNLKDSDADTFKVGFRVTKAWLDDNGLASGDIALYRFADSAWNELATRVAGTDSTYVNYEADTPGFSSFAIATKSGVAPSEEAGEEVTEETPTEEGAPEEVGGPVPVQAPGKAPTAWIIAAIVIILGIILIVMYQKKKQQG